MTNAQSKSLTTIGNRGLPGFDAGSPLLDPGTFEGMWRLAEAMARAKTLGQHLQGSPGDCLRVIELAYRCGQSPFALADHTFFTAGKLAMDGQAIASLINAHPKIEGSLDYTYRGEGQKRECVVSGKLVGENKIREVTVTLEQGLRDSKGARQRWEHDTDQMLSYYGARKWARRHAPEVIHGLYTPDELRAGMEAEREAIKDSTPPQSEVIKLPRHDSETGEVREPAPPRRTTPAFRLMQVTLDDGTVHGTSSDPKYLARLYDEAKRRSSDTTRCAIRNLDLLRYLRGIFGDKAMLKCEIEAAEAVAMQMGEPEEAGDEPTLDERFGMVLDKDDAGEVELMLGEKEPA